MQIAVIGTSKKENEKRVPIHPLHLFQIPDVLRRNLFFEKGYGDLFGMKDAQIQALTGNPCRSRDDLLASSQTVLITKPVLDDYESMGDGTVIWGWIHAVQQSTITQIAIDKKLTFIAWESMYYRTEREQIHIFNKNNEMAGYCGVQHALQLRGIDGNYGPARKISVISLGSVSRGAIYALLGHGFNDITVYTRRPSFLAGNKIPGIAYKQMMEAGSGSFQVAGQHRKKLPLIEELTTADIIVNGMLQDPNNPVFFIRDEDIEKFTKECLIIDISCDIGMGFSFACPTDFTNPVSKIGNITYYAVDHTPTLLWDSASWEISNGIMPYLQNIVDQTDNPVLTDATDIRQGNILNKDILEYQHRLPEYPYRPIIQ